MAILHHRSLLEGHLLEIHNCTGLFNRIYANEGICQLLFYRGVPCEKVMLRKRKISKSTK